MTVLIVDDDPGLLELLDHNVKKKFPELDVVSVSDGARAREFFATATPDVIVTDVLMPGMGGVELLFLLNSDPRFDKCRVVAITGLEMDDPRVASLKESGLRRIVHKETGFAKNIIAAIEDALQASNRAEFNLMEKIAAEHSSHYEGVDPDVEGGAYVGHDTVKAERQVFNRDALFKSLDSNAEIMRVALKSFLGSAGQVMQEIEKSIVAGKDFQEAARTAHTLAGSAGSIGGERVRDIAAKIEFLLKDSEIVSAATLLPELRSEFNQLVASIKENV